MKKRSKYTGQIHINSKGTGFVDIEDFEDDIMIYNNFLNTALDGDMVEIYLFPRVKGKRLTGEVNKIIERNKLEFVGTIHKKKNANYAFLITDDPKMYRDIFIPKVTNESKNN